MRLYLIQHGEALAKEVDPERPLAPGGRDEVRRVAGFLARSGGVVAPETKVWHSGKLRARQTAELYAAALDLPAPESSEGIQPLDDPGVWGQRLAETETDLMLVGHLPHLAKLATLLLGGPAGEELIRFRMGGIVCLGRDEGHWSVRWQVIPEIVPVPA